MPLPALPWGWGALLSDGLGPLRVRVEGPASPPTPISPNEGIYLKSDSGTKNNSRVSSSIKGYWSLCILLAGELWNESVVSGQS